MSRGERKAMITRDAPELSLSRQCRLGFRSAGPRSIMRPGGDEPFESGADASDRRVVHEVPVLRQPTRWSSQLRRDGVCVGRHRVRRLMRLIGLEAIYAGAEKPSVPHPMHRIYPYLLKGMAIDQPNRVWCADITYIPVQRGFLYLVAIMDWATRHVLSWRLSNTMDAGFCAEALGRRAWPATASRRYSIRIRAASSPASTSPAVLKNASIRISMDGRGRCMDKHLHRAPVAVSQV